MVVYINQQLIYVNQFHYLRKYRASIFLNGVECFDKQIKPLTWKTVELIYVNHLVIYVNTRCGGCLHESTTDLCKSISPFT